MQQNVMDLWLKLLVFLCNWGSSTKCVHKIFGKKLTFLTPLIRTHTCAYQGVRHVSFSENVAYILNGWLHMVLNHDWQHIILCSLQLSLSSYWLSGKIYCISCGNSFIALAEIRKVTDFIAKAILAFFKAANDKKLMSLILVALLNWPVVATGWGFLLVTGLDLPTKEEIENDFWAKTKFPLFLAFVIFTGRHMIHWGSNSNGSKFQRSIIAYFIEHMIVAFSSGNPFTKFWQHFQVFQFNSVKGLFSHFTLD